MHMKKTTFFGLPVADVSRITGIPYVIIYRHAQKQRRISADDAWKYYRLLGIPLYLLRPDLWTKEMCDTLPNWTPPNEETSELYKQGEW